MKHKPFMILVALMISTHAYAQRDGGRDAGRGGNNGYGNNNNYVVVPYDAGNLAGNPNSNQPVTVMNGPNGSTQTQVGTTTYYSPGGSSVTNGNRTIYSNGTNCVVQGNKKTCN
jgi:hypothetical protein